jgi:hypothetical protein
MTIAYANSTTSTNLGASGGATAAMDTTGDDLIVVAVSRFAAGTLSDSQSNTWTQVGSAVDAGNPAIELYYCDNPTVNTAHTFTYSGSNTYPSVQAVSYTGTNPIVPSQGLVASGTATATSITLSSNTPDNANSLVFSAQGTDIGETASVNSSMTIRQNNAWVSGQQMGCAVADIIQTTATAIGPQWSSASSGQRAAGMIFFYEATPEIKVSNVTAQMLVIPSVIEKSVTDTLSLIQEPFARKIRVSNFTVQVLQIENGVFETVADTIDFEQTVFQFNAIADRQVPENTINFTQEVIWTNLGNMQVADTINFTQTVRQNLLKQDLTQNMSLQSNVSWCKGVNWTPYELTDTIEFLQHLSNQGALEVSVSDTINFSQSVTDKGNTIVHVINFNQSVSVGKGYLLSSKISFDHSLDTESLFLRVVEDANFVQHAMTYYFDDGCGKKQYQQYTGEGSAAGVGPQRLTFDANMAVESISTGDILVLRNPETDDKDRIGFNRINRETRGGELNVFGDPGWAKVNTLLFTIVALADGTKSNCPDVIRELLEFFQDNLGQEIYLHDWTGTSWRGVVTTPNETATEDKNGWWTIAFEFEGEADDGSVPNNNLAITDGFSANWDRLRVMEDTLAFTQTVTVGGSIYLSVSDNLNLTDNYSGTVETVLLDDVFTAGAAVDLEGTSPGTGSSTWRAHQEYQDNGTMVANVNAGAYYPFTPQQGHRYLLQVESANVVTYSDADNCIWGFFEGISLSDIVTGSGANGEIDPTTAKAVHLMRETGGGTRNNAYRLGDESDGQADTSAWTDGTLNASPDAVLDLRIELDTTAGAGNWTAQWWAKGLISGSYTEVGPVTNMLNENVGAVGFSNDSGNTKLTTDQITLTEIKDI